MEADHSYFSRRAHEERVAAMKAAHPSARRSHLDLAARHERRAAAAAAEFPLAKRANDGR